MKTRIISFFLSLLFLSILSVEYISNTAIAEDSTSKTIEYVFEKRLADKFIDDTYLHSKISIILGDSTNCLHSFKKVFYSFVAINTLFKPPRHT